MIISQGQPQPMNGHMQIQNGQQIQMPNGQPGTIVMTSQPQMQQQPRPQGIRMVRVYNKDDYFVRMNTPRGTFLCEFSFQYT